MTQSMKNKIAVVTGATSGIGRATVVDFATHGVNVVASGRREDRGAELVEETHALPGKVIFVRADVTVAEDVENLMKSAVSEFGRIDYAFNNAGGGTSAARRESGEPLPPPRVHRRSLGPLFRYVSQERVAMHEA